MHILFKDIKPIEKDAPRQGTGRPTFRYMSQDKDMDERIEMMAHITLNPGDAIGPHPHEQDAEIYYILKGELEAEDDGEWLIAREGDMIFTTGGENHQIKNNSDQPAEFLAIILT